MYKKKKILGLIPARSGSKGLPGKNIRPLLGKPLIAWTIEQALASSYIDKVVVSTDDKKIAEIARRYGAETPFFRPTRLAKDKTKSIEVILHALRYFRKYNSIYDYLILLEPTSPLRQVRDIDISLKMLINNKIGAVSIVSVSKVVATHPEFDMYINKKGLFDSYSGDFSKAGRRQDLESLYFPEGTIYVSEVTELIKRKGFYHDKTMPYIVSKWRSFEVDDIVDLICIEAMLKNMSRIKKAGLYYE